MFELKDKNHEATSLPQTRRSLIRSPNRQKKNRAEPRHPSVQRDWKDKDLTKETEKGWLETREIRGVLGLGSKRGL